MALGEERKGAHLEGMRHIALRVTDIRASRRFYIEQFGMELVWTPDEGAVYLSSGVDNLALHQIPAGEPIPKDAAQRLDHFGFIAENEAVVDAFHARMKQDGVPIVKPPKRHRDGSYSFYLADPDGNVIQILYEPRISRKRS